MSADIGRLGYGTFIMVLIVLLLIFIGRLAYFFVADVQRFPINTVKITASYQHITRKQLESVLANYRNASFFTLPVSQLYAELSAFDWTKQVRVDRVWPDTLKITLVEKIPVAIWNNAMITADGEVFNENRVSTEKSLPYLSGPTNQQKIVLQVYQKISKILATYSLQVASLAWSDNQAWELTLGNGLRLRLGKRELETRITRFCKAYPAVFAEQSEQLVSVDLRYPRGMAVQWKK
jgi:cell division protein FtsQ